MHAWVADRADHLRHRALRAMMGTLHAAVAQVSPKPGGLQILPMLETASWLE